jgi:hypothetical protein
MKNLSLFSLLAIGCVVTTEAPAQVAPAAAPSQLMEFRTFTEHLNESIDSVLNSILTPELLNAWSGLTSTSQIRIAVLIGCSVLAGAILMTAGARFLFLAGLIVLVTPELAGIVHHTIGVDEASVRDALCVAALVAGGLGAFLAALTVIRRAALMAIAAVVAIVVYAGATPQLLGLLPTWNWIESVLQSRHVI